MKKSEKNFDCVEMKRTGAMRVYEATKDMSPEEEMAYWRDQDEEMRRRFPNMRTLEVTQAPSRKG
jgi:hypothetical protein